MLATFLFVVALGLLISTGMLAIVFDQLGNSDAVIQTCKTGIVLALIVLGTSAIRWKRIKDYVIKQN